MVCLCSYPKTGLGGAAAELVAINLRRPNQRKMQLVVVKDVGSKQDHTLITDHIFSSSLV